MIEVNEYVRTEEGYLGILIAINKQDYNYLVVDTSIEVRKDGYPSTYLYLKKENIKNHSKQLIDLIEVGDIVNGMEVLAVMEDMQTGELHLEMTSNYTNEEIGDCSIYDKDIKAILTKEQMEANQYVVK